jgi:hypothetical protein
LGVKRKVKKLWGGVVASTPSIREISHIKNFGPLKDKVFVLATSMSSGKRIVAIRGQLINMRD